MQSSPFRKFLFTALAFILFLGMLEGASRVYTFIHSERKTQIKDATYRLDPQFGQLNWTEELKAHPYFGFIRKSVADDIEKLKARSETPRSQRPYVVVLTGGSVAQILGQSLEKNFAQRLQETIPELKNRQVEFYNFAAGGYRQPQQYFLLSYLIGSVDMVINLDGFNDVTDFDGRWLLPREYPMLSNQFFPESGRGSSYRMAAHLIRWLYAAINEIPKQSAVIASSHSYFYFWQAAHNILFANFRKLEDKFEAANQTANGYSDRFPVYLATWEKYVRLSAFISKVSGVRYLTFVQPNQYLANGKPMSSSERALAIHIEAEPVNSQRMNGLKIRAEQLSNEGLPVVNLMDLFQKELRPIYIDDCCHINNLGNTIMADSLLGSIQSSWR